MKISKSLKERNLKTVYKLFDCDFSKALWGNLPFINLLQKLGAKGEVLFYKIQKLRLILFRKISLPFCCFFTTTRCTLNCSGCCAYMPEYTKDTHFPPIGFENFKHDLDKLLKAVDQIHIFQFFGGEPLLCKDLPEMIKYAKSKKQLKHIFMTTNCTIFPSQELIDSLKNSRVVVQISDYRKTASNIKLYYEEIKELFQKNNIKYCNYQEDSETWGQFPIIYPEGNRQNPCAASLSVKGGGKCSYAYSKDTIICDGKIFQCSAALCIYRNYYKKEFEGQYIDINSKTLQDDLIKFYSDDYSEFCKYCSGIIKNVHITKGVQIARK